MKTYSHILAFDPSGNFEEGKGTTGCCIFSAETGTILEIRNIHAAEYKTKEDYWQAHIDYTEYAVTKYKPRNLILVIEDFMLDPKRALQQSHSRMETPKLIGIIQHWCSVKNIPYAMQRPTDVKKRWADHILEYKGFIQRYKNTFILPGELKSVSRHCKDAIRHAVHYYYFKNKEIMNDRKRR